MSQKNLSNDYFERINGLTSLLSNEERHLLKAGLARKIPSFFDNKNAINISDPKIQEEFDRLAYTLKVVTPNSESIPNNGIAYYGRPNWLSSNRLADLQLEAAQRRYQPLDRTDHFLGCGGEVADRLAVSTVLNKFVTQIIGPAKATGIASYLYYDEAGLGIKPHIDTNVFSINLMIMLRHDTVDCAAERSATLVFPSYQKPESYRLEVGEVMIMYGNSIIHTRSPVSPGEIVTLLTIGFSRDIG